MLYYVAKPGNLTSMGDYFLVDLAADAREHLRMVSYPTLFSTPDPPPGVYILSDHELLSHDERERLEEVADSLRSAPIASMVLNHPRTVLPRIDMLKAQHAAGFNDFTAYRLGEDLSGARLPSFVRWADDHAKPRTELLYDAEAVRAAMEHLVAQEPGRADKVFAAEYCAEPTLDGNFVVFGAFRVGTTVFPAEWMATADWKQSVINHPMEDWVKGTRAYFFDFPHAIELDRAFKVAGVDYGRADYALVRGRVQVYEINTNPRTSRSMGKDLADVTATFTNRLDAALLDLLRTWREQGGAAGHYVHPNFEADHRRNAIFVLLWNLKRLARSSYRAPVEFCSRAASLLQRARVFLGPLDRAVVWGSFLIWLLGAIVRRGRRALSDLWRATIQKGVTWSKGLSIVYPHLMLRRVRGSWTR